MANFLHLRSLLHSPALEDFTEVLSLDIPPQVGVMDQILTPRRVSDLSDKDVGLTLVRLVDKISLGAPVSLNNSTFTDIFVLESVTTASLKLVQVSVFDEEDPEPTLCEAIPQCWDPEWKTKMRVVVQRASQGYIWAIVHTNFHSIWKPELSKLIPLTTYQLLDVRGSPVVEETFPSHNLATDFAGVVSPSSGSLPHQFTVNVSDRQTASNLTNSKFIELVHGFNSDVRSLLAKGSQSNYFENVAVYFFPTTWASRIPILRDSDWLRGFYLGAFDTSFARPSAKDKHSKFFLSDFIADGMFVSNDDTLKAVSNVGVVMDLVAQANLCVHQQLNDISVSGWGRIFKNFTEYISSFSFGNYYQLELFPVKFVHERIVSSLAAFFGSFFLSSHWVDCSDIHQVRIRAAPLLQINLSDWIADCEGWQKNEDAAAARKKNKLQTSPDNNKVGGNKKPKGSDNNSSPSGKGNRVVDKAYGGRLFCLHDLLFVLQIPPVKPEKCKANHGFEHLKTKEDIFANKADVLEWIDKKVQSFNVHASLVAAVRALPG